ncbi:MAG TPA: hypothetical protein PK625_01745 [Spirochaetales bacterium]|nr:hypothetical protein [Spirochaetales bacterium]
MAWYWWVVIIIGVIVVGAAKLTLFKKIMAKRSEHSPADDED